MEAKKRVLAEDINNLVALTSTTTLNSTSSFHQRLTNEPTVVFSQRITIQDAIATLLLDGRPDEVYAVAVQLDISHDVPRDAITVYISTKHQVSSSTTTYLEDIWELMQRRSEDYEVFASQKMAFDLQKAHLTEKERLDNEPTVAVENYHKLIRMVYVHCFDRWIGWIRRSHNEVARFKDIVVKIVAEELLESGLESYRWLDALAYLIDQFDWVYTKAEALENQGQPAVELVYREEFPRKVEGLEIAFGLLERSTSVLTLLEDWNSRCENPAKPIYMHLRRLAEFQIAIAQLDRLTHPRRFRRYKKRSLEIVYIDDFNSEPILTSLPTKVGDWENVMAKALGHAHVELIEEHKPLLLPIYNDLVVAASSRDDHYGTSIHPPSQLLLFLATSPVYPPPLPQIGCSRSPCAACAAVFSAWWALNDAPSFTCRSSDGWYPLSWSVPTEWKELRVQHEVAILEVVYDKVAERFARSMLELGLVKVKGSRESEDWGQEKDTRAKEIEEDDQKQEPSGTDGQP